MPTRGFGDVGTAGDSASILARSWQFAANRQPKRWSVTPRSDSGIIVLRVHYSNQPESLLRALLGRLEEDIAVGGILRPIEIVVPNHNLERFLELGIAQARGVAANLAFSRLQRSVVDWVTPVLAANEQVLTAAALEKRILVSLLHQLPEPRSPIHRYLAGPPGERDKDGLRELRTTRLAIRLARLFEEYSFSRPEMVAAWLEGRDVVGSPAEAWQRPLFVSVTQQDPYLVPLSIAVQRSVDSGDSPIHVFGFSYVARAFQMAIATLARSRDVHVYALNPCREFWEDVRRTKPPSAEGDDPFGLLADTENRLLQLWGRPGREHVALLNQLTESDFHDYFVEPPTDSSLLHAVQSDVLRRTSGRKRRQADRSIETMACPGIRREVEAVAEEIWSRIRTDPTLRFNQIAVLVNDAERERYLPHIEAVFHAAQRIPHHVVDFTAASAGSVREAVQLLLQLPFSRYRRPEVLALLNHPVVGGSDPELSSESSIDLCDRLGIFHGRDRLSHRGTYIEGDEVNWDQGIKRIVLGQLINGEVDGRMRFVSIDEHDYAPEEASGASLGTVRFAQLVRLLLTFALEARSSERSLSSWADFFARWLTTLVSPQTDRDESELRRLLFAAQEIGGSDELVSYQVASELLRSRLSGERGRRGEYLADGVAVCSFLPMRVVPFRFICILGLSESAFPAPAVRDTLDLRMARREVGDVSPTERDAYAFLEAILCAREQLLLSYVARDEFTGDEVPPSSVIQELAATIRDSYGVILPVRQVSLHRHDEHRPDRAIIEAEWEREAARLGAAWQRRGGGDSLAAASFLSSRGKSQLQSFLRQWALPAPPDEVDPSPRRLTLFALHEFLRCPLQGWSRSSLGLMDEEEELRGQIEDEPFAPSSLRRAVSLSEVFQSVIAGASITESYQAAVRRHQANGEWPVGAVAKRWARVDVRVLDQWMNSYRDELSGLPLRRLRIGADGHFREVDGIIDSLELETAHGLVSITGTTSLFSGGPERPGPVRCAINMGDKGDRLWRHLLRSFVDHVVLVATGVLPEGPSRAYLFDGGANRSLDLPAISRDTALGFLVSLADDIVERSHAYFLPCEVAFGLRAHWRDLTPERFEQQVGRVRRDGGSSRFGPILHVERYEAPSFEDAVAMLARRYDLFFALYGEIE